MNRGANLSIINLTRTEQRFQGVIARHEKAGKVNKKFASNVEEDKEKVDSDEAEKGVDLGHRSLFFEIVEHGVFGQLHYPVVSTILRRDDTE